MTKEEALEKLNKIYNNSLEPNKYYPNELYSHASEEGHIEADDILCEFLRSLGYDDVVDIYDKIGKWYA